MLITAIPKLAYSENIQIDVVTENAFPLQYLENDQLVGPAFDVVAKVLAEANLDYTLSVVPWARAYAKATSKPNTLIFSIARTPSREDKFYWIGSLMELHYYFYGLKNKFEQNGNKFPVSQNQLKSMRIGSILDSATYQYLIVQHFTKVYAVATPQQNFDKLLTGRIDLFPANFASFEASCVKYKTDCSQIMRVAPLGLPATKLYFAISKSTSAAVVEQITQAYQRLISQNLIDLDISKAENSLFLMLKSQVADD